MNKDPLLALRGIDELDRCLIDWRMRGFPASWEGRPVADCLRDEPNLLDDHFTFPIAVLDGAVLDGNVGAMAAYCRRNGVLLAPHAKTTMAPRIWRRQAEHGAWAFAAANVEQARALIAFGVKRIIVANEIADRAALAWLAGALAKDPTLSVMCFVDSKCGIEMVEGVWREHGCGQPLPVFVDLGYVDGRTGVRSVGEAEQLAAAIEASASVELIGTAGYEGTLGRDGSADTRTHISEYLRFLRAATERLIELRLLAHDRPALVTAGGSAYFDLVVEVLGRGWPADVKLVVRSGCYIAHDAGLYDDIQRTRVRGVTPFFKPALTVWGRVISAPEVEQVLVNVGRRDVSTDVAPPKPLRIWSARDSAWRDALHLSTTRMSDHHSFVNKTAEVSEGMPAVGDIIVMGISHPCTTFDKWRLIPLVDREYTVRECVATFF